MSPQFRTASVYILLSTSWIWFSDRALNAVVQGQFDVTVLQSIKGGVFVLATGALLYWMVGRDLRRLEQANESLLRGHEQSMRVIVSAMDLRHKETGDHSERVTRMATGLARLAGIRDDALHQLKMGALLHDIGKLTIPDTVLLKPGKLDDEEMALMRQHAKVGHDLLQKVDFLRDAGDIPHSHHERWDGTGYPQGLRGEQIPLAARIFSVVDVWDALIMPRVYKPGWPEKEVLDYLRDAAGTQLDPKLVQLFIDHYEELRELGLGSRRVDLSGA